MAYDFDGTDDRLEYNTNSQALYEGLASLTVSMYGLAASSGNKDAAYFSERETIASKGGGSPSAFILGLDPGVSGKWRWLVISSDPATRFCYSNSVASTSAWEHVVGTYDSGVGGAIEMWVNGTKQTDTTDTSADSTFDGTIATDGVRIGGYESDSGPANDFVKGKIAHVAFWNTALSDEEVGMLAEGVIPTMVRPGNLIFYAPCDGRDGGRDIVGGFDPTVAGAPAYADGPRVIQPSVSGLVTETGFRITSVSSDDIVPTTEDPWNIAGRGFGAR